MYNLKGLSRCMYIYIVAHKGLSLCSYQVGHIQTMYNYQGNVSNPVDVIAVITLANVALNSQRVRY